MGLRKQNRFSAVIHWKIRRREEELDEQLLEALKGIREKDLTGERLLAYKILKEVLEKEQAGKGWSCMLSR
ncbi:MAG: hypothetical protein ACLVAW_24915 [Eisenbergiella massiliensis]